MILISHRGNINGKNSKDENSPKYINKAIEKEYIVEVDVWYKNGFYLGHDNPQYKIDIDFLQRGAIWCHAKNLEALTKMKEYSNIHYFWHQQDAVAITSRGYILCKPSTYPIQGSIAILPELQGYNITNCAGICSDNIEDYNERY